MSKAFVIFLFFSAIAGFCNSHHGHHNHNCDENQAYRRCGSNCKEYCHWDPSAMSCLYHCNGDCYCREGYVLESVDSGTCIPKANCSSIPQCYENAEYRICGSACPDYCGKPDDGSCADVCVSGCFCKPGYILEGGGSMRCIPEYECPELPVCGENEEYTICGSRCPDYCGKPEGIMCPAVCTPGCFCKQGYILSGGVCIPEDQCPEIPSCPENQIYLSCGPSCPEYCGNPDEVECPDVCNPGCFCQPGYIFSSDALGECVPSNECPEQ